LSPNSSVLLLAKTMMHTAARSLCDSWASCECYLTEVWHICNQPLVTSKLITHRPVWAPPQQFRSLSNALFPHVEIYLFIYFSVFLHKISPKQNSDILWKCSIACLYFVFCIRSLIHIYLVCTSLTAVNCLNLNMSFAKFSCLIKSCMWFYDEKLIVFSMHSSSENPDCDYILK